MELHTGMTMHEEDNIGRLVQAAYKPAVPRPEFKERLLKRLQTVGSTSNRDEVVKLRETGLNYAEIGRRVGITRERVRQILNEKPGPRERVGQPRRVGTQTLGGDGRQHRKIERNRAWRRANPAGEG